jgi:glutaredoxin
VLGLPVYQGYGCPHCLYITRTLDSMEKHRRAEHQEQDGI